MRSLFREAVHDDRGIGFLEHYRVGGSREVELFPGKGARLIGKLQFPPSSRNEDGFPRLQSRRLGCDDGEGLLATGHAVDARLVGPAHGIAHEVQMVVDEARDDGASL